MNEQATFSNPTQTINLESLTIPELIELNNKFIVQIGEAELNKSQLITAVYQISREINNKQSTDNKKQKPIYNTLDLPKLTKIA